MTLSEPQLWTVSHMELLPFAWTILLPHKLAIQNFNWLKLHVWIGVPITPVYNYCHWKKILIFPSLNLVNPLLVNNFSFIEINHF